MLVIFPYILLAVEVNWTTITGLVVACTSAGVMLKGFYDSWVSKSKREADVGLTDADTAKRRAETKKIEADIREQNLKADDLLATRALSIADRLEEDLMKEREVRKANELELRSLREQLDMSVRLVAEMQEQNRLATEREHKYIAEIAELRAEAKKLKSQIATNGTRVPGE